MPHEIVPIHLALPLPLGAVNCYLVKTGSGHILIDTGSSHRRAGVARLQSLNVQTV
jgi:glyoxylase-like metal-dependent hydrolase (beta-lactamase superfamily II)